MLDGCPVLGKKLQQTGYIFIAPLSRPRNTKRVSPSFLFCWNVRNGRLRHSPLSSSFWYRKDSTFVLDIADLWDHFLEEFPSIIRPEDCAKGREEGTEEFRHRHVFLGISQSVSFFYFWYCTPLHGRRRLEAKHWTGASKEIFFCSRRPKNPRADRKSEAMNGECLDWLSFLYVLNRISYST